MFLKLFLAFTIIPVIEIYILIQIGSVFGPLTSVALVIFTGFLGAYLARLQGMQTILRIQENLKEGRMPSSDLLDALLIGVAGLVLLPIWSAFHFYWVHRLLHVPFIYKHVHSLHHRNVNIGPWSGLSMHPVEHLLYLSSLLIHCVFPSHLILVYFHVIYLGPGAAMTHTGYEDLLVRDKRRLALGTFYHQLHHRYYECNYGNQEMPWDRWFGTFHDGSDDETQATRTRKKTMYSNI